MALDIFHPKSEKTDILVEKILTPLFGYNSNKEELFFSSAMEIFLTGVLALVAILFIFNIINETTNTANSGKLLGGKGSLTWNTVRAMIGIALLLPLKKGIATAQILFIWLVGQGLMLSNSIYEKMDWFNFNNNNLTFVSNIQADLLNAYKTAVVSNVCLISASKHSGADSTGKNYNFNVKVSTVKKTETRNIIYRFGNQATSSENEICGRIIVSFSNIKKEKVLNTGSSLDDLNNFNLIDTEKVSDSIQTAHAQAMNDLIVNKARATAELIVRGGISEQLDEVVAKKIVEDLKTYEDKIRSTVENVSKLDDSVKEYMTKHGIAGAGSWIWALSNSQTTLTNIVNDLPKVTATYNSTGSVDKKCSGLTGWFSNECSVSKALNSISPSILADGNKALTTFSNAEALIGSKVIGDNKFLAQSAKATTEESSVKDKFLSMFDGLSIESLTVDRTEGNNPLVVIQSFGQNILLVVEGAIVALIAGSWFSDAIVSVAIVSFPFLLSIAVSAVMIVFYFPFLPFILWMGNLIGWIVMICQAMLGIPLWLVSFIRNDTDNFVGKTGQGYLLILEGFLRPSLMIFALFFAFNLLIPVVSILNFFFMFVGNSIYSNTNGLLVIFYYVFMIVIYAVLLNKIMLILFGLIETIPDKILIWIGSNINSIMSNAGKDLDNYAQQGTEKGLSTVSGATGMMANGSVKGINNLGNLHRERRAELAKKKEEIMLQQQMAREGGDNEIINEAEKSFTAKNIVREAMNNPNNPVNANTDKTEDQKPEKPQIDKAREDKALNIKN